jgi:hypothetical protein
VQILLPVGFLLQRISWFNGSVGFGIRKFVKSWVSFVLGAAIGWGAGYLRRFRSEMASPVPVGWVEVDGFYLSRDGWAAVLFGYDWRCCSPSDVLVVVDGKLRSDVVEAFGNRSRRCGALVGHWRAWDDSGVGDVRVFVRKSRAVFYCSDNLVPGRWVLGGGGS